MIRRVLAAVALCAALIARAVMLVTPAHAQGGPGVQSRFAEVKGTQALGANMLSVVMAPDQRCTASGEQRLARFTL